MTNQNFLVCLVGLPASGKSTFANKLKIALKRRFNNLDVKIIDPDIIRQIITPDKFIHEKEHLVRLRNLKIIREELEKGNIVISDDLNYYSSMRHDLREIANTLNLSFFIVHIATPIEICMKWNKNRGEPIPSTVIDKINEKFDKFNKYNWDFAEATYDLSQISDLNGVIDDLLDSIIEKMDVLRRELRSTIVDQFSNVDNESLDKTTRIYVGKLLLNAHHINLKKKIIKLRKIFVKQNKNKALRQKEILESFKKFLEERLNIEISQKHL